MEIQAEVESAVKSVEKESEQVLAKTVEALNEAKHVTSVAVEKVEKVVEKTTQELAAEEKLAIREIENTYLKAQMEITRLSQITQKAQKDFTDTVESLTRKYVVPVETWLFDNVSLTFRKK